VRNKSSNVLQSSFLFVQTSNAVKKMIDLFKVLSDVSGVVIKWIDSLGQYSILYSVSPIFLWFMYHHCTLSLEQTLFAFSKQKLREKQLHTMIWQSHERWVLRVIRSKQHCDKCYTYFFYDLFVDSLSEWFKSLQWCLYLCHNTMNVKG